MPFPFSRINNREKKKMGHAVKANIVGKKLGWFAEQLENRSEALTSQEFEELINRFVIQHLPILRIITLELEKDCRLDCKIRPQLGQFTIYCVLYLQISFKIRRGARTN